MEVVKIEGKRAIQISRQQQIAAGMETHSQQRDIQGGSNHALDTMLQL
jgi:hypothetical protein